MPQSAAIVEAMYPAMGASHGRSLDGSERLRERNSEESFSRGGGLTANAWRAFNARQALSAVFAVTGNMNWRRHNKERSGAAAVVAAVFLGESGFPKGLCHRTIPSTLFRGSMRYRSEATSVEGFVQQIACCYLRHGYWWYVTGQIPKHKDPRDVDKKLIDKYGVAISTSTRARRKRLGYANLQYIRYERFFAFFSTKGRHQFFVEEANSIHDIRQIPLKFGGYSISYRRGGRTPKGDPDPKWHAHVAIERRRYLDLKAYFLELAIHRSAEDLALAFYRIPFEPYAPVRRQILNILRAVNRARKRASYSRIPVDVLPLRRRVVRPFEPRSRIP